MTTNLKEKEIDQNDPHIHSHVAWCGHITGLDAEEKLKGERLFVYLLREGESPSNYYVSFVDLDGRIKHQPFLIRLSPHGWYCRNGNGSGPFLNQTIEEVVHLIMHCKQEECAPLKSSERT